VRYTKYTGWFLLAQQLHRMTAEEFKLQRDAIPNQPGIYKYLNEAGEIIYIGKAKDLKKRVSSYFTSTDHTNRIKRMIHFIRNIELVIVDTEQDAFLLENSLIKSISRATM
jgi:excinuclease ABC subunit C